MDRADWLRITAAFGLALVTSESALQDVRVMVLAARDEWKVSTATDRVGVNLDLMNVDGMLRVPYVEGTVTGRVLPRGKTVAVTSSSVDSSSSVTVRVPRNRAVKTPAPTYPRVLRSSKRVTA